MRARGSERAAERSFRSWSALLFGVVAGGVPLFAIAAGCGNFDEAGGPPGAATGASDSTGDAQPLGSGSASGSGSATTGPTTTIPGTTTSVPPAASIATPVGQGKCNGLPSGSSSSTSTSSGGSSSGNSVCFTLTSGVPGFTFAPKESNRSIAGLPVGDCVTLQYDDLVGTIDFRGYARASGCAFECEPPASQPCNNSPPILVFGKDAGSDRYLGSGQLQLGSQILELAFPPDAQVTKLTLCNGPGDPSEMANVVDAVGACSK